MERTAGALKGKLSGRFNTNLKVPPLYGESDYATSRPVRCLKSSIRRTAALMAQFHSNTLFSFGSTTRP